MRRDHAWLLGLLAALVLAPAQGAAASVPVPPPAAVQCPPGMLCRTVIDRSAWDEELTLTLRAAWDEEVTLTLEPERTATRSVQLRPPDLVHYKVEVTPARTVTHTYLIEAGHYETQRQWVTSGYWQDFYVDTSHSVYVSGYWAYSQGYWAYSSGYWAYQPGYWARSSGYWAYSSGYWAYSGGYWSWSCNSWWCWPSWVSGYSYWVSGYSYWVSGYSYWVSGYSYWVSGSSYWVSGYSYWVPGYSYWVRSGYWDSRYIDTSGYQSRQVWVPDRWGTWTEYVPAVYSEWYELVPAVMGLEPYTIPAVTTTDVVHHTALTQTEIQHHDALTREIATDPATLTTQSRQSAASRNVPATTSTTTRVRAPVHIPLVAGATVSAGNASAWLGSSGRDSWWADLTADEWVSGGAATSYSSISSRAVSDAPLRGDAYLTSGGPGSSSGAGDLLLLLMGLATAGAAAHQLARTSGSAGTSTGAAGTGVTTLPSPSVRGAPARGPDLVRPTGASGGLYVSSGSRSVRHEPAAAAFDPFGSIERAWNEGTNAARSVAREVAYAIAETGNTAHFIATNERTWNAAGQLGQNTLDIPEGAVGLVLQMAAGGIPGAGEGREVRKLYERTEGRDLFAVLGEIGTIKREAQAEAGGLGTALTVAEAGTAVVGGVQAGIRAYPAVRRGVAAVGRGIREVRNSIDEALEVPLPEFRTVVSEGVNAANPAELSSGVVSTFRNGEYTAYSGDGRLVRWVRSDNVDSPDLGRFTSPRSAEAVIRMPEDAQHGLRLPVDEAGNFLNTADRRVELTLRPRAVAYEGQIAGGSPDLKQVWVANTSDLTLERAQNWPDWMDFAIGD